MLAILFQLTDKRGISRALERARYALITEFVPRNLGFNHIARQEIIDQHTSTIAHQLLCRDETDKAIIVGGGTYIYELVHVSHDRIKQKLLNRCFQILLVL